MSNQTPEGVVQPSEQDTCPTGAGDPIIIATGDVVAYLTDVAVTGPLPFSISRNYDSSNAEVKGLFGYGWTSSLDAEVRLFYDQIHYRDSLGKDVLYPLVDIGKTKFCGIRKMEISRDEKNVFLTGKNGIRRRFDTDNPEKRGRLAEMIDLNDNRIQFLYENQRLKEIIDSNGRSFNLHYNRTGMISAISSFFQSEDKEINLRAYNYNKNDCLITVLDELQNPFSYDYNTENRIIKKTNRIGYSYFYTYNEDGRCTKGWGEDGMLTVEFKYYPRERKTEVFDCSGNKTTYYYYPNKLFSMVVDPLGKNTQYYYDKQHNLIGIIKKDKNSIEYSFDTDGNLTRIRDEEGHVREFSKGARHYKITDPLGNVTFEEYDERRNLIRRTYPDGSNEEFEHNVRGEVIKIKTVTDKNIKIHREGTQKVVVENPAGSLTTYLMNDWGRIVVERDSQGNEIRSEYDIKQRLTARIHKNGYKTTYHYDAEDNLISNIDPLGNERCYGYDGFKHVIESTDPKGHTVQINFNNNGTVAEIINQNGETHTYHYDVLNRMTLQKGFDDQTTEYVYDPADNIVKVIRPDGRFIDFSYDRKGRLTSVTVKSRYGVDEHIVYFYDAADNLIEAQNKDSTLSFVYNEMNQLIREIQNDATIEWNYKSGNALFSRQTSWSGMTEYHYDDMVQLVAISLPGNKIIRFERDEVGRRTSYRFPNDVVVENRYDNVGQLESQQYFHGDNRLIQRNYRYDPNGRLAKASDYTDYREYIYDKMGQLSCVKHLLNQRIEDFNYDPAGNMVLRDLKENAGYSKGNLIERFNGNRYWHDANGNMIEKIDDRGRTLYQYNGFDQLVRVILPDGNEFRYFYDTLGRRIEKRDVSNEKSTYFFWNGFKLAAEMSDGSVIEYSYYPGTFVPMSKQKNGRLYFYSVDQLGTPYELIDEVGSIVWASQYDAFGTCRIDDQSSVQQNIRFQGQYFDSETGLHYNYRRYYDPVIGRYIAADPIGLISEMNLFVYAFYNPINQIDPKGLEYSKGNITSYDIDYGGPGSWKTPPSGAIGNIGNYKTWEMHVVVGTGELYLTCCDGCKKRQHKYKKICVGAAIAVSYGEGQTTGADGDSCKNPPQKLLGVELGADTPIPFLGGEGGAVVDMAGGSDVSVSGGYSSGIGMGAKATACHYWLIESKPIGNCSL